MGLDDPAVEGGTALHRHLEEFTRRNEPLHPLGELGVADEVAHQLVIRQGDEIVDRRGVEGGPAVHGPLRVGRHVVRMATSLCRRRDALRGALAIEAGAIEVELRGVGGRRHVVEPAALLVECRNGYDVEVAVGDQLRGACLT